MLKTVGLGLQDYEKVITENVFYVDKTNFITEWWNSKDDVTLITRPRRFGKTLMLSTVEKFFSVRQGNNEELFKGSNVSEDTEMMKECGKWPVLFVSFASIKRENFKGALVQFNQLFTEMASELSFLKDNLDDKERKFYDAISDDMDVDLMLRPKDKKDNAVIIEFKSKRRSEKGKTLEELCDMALKQIEDKKYESELLSAGYDKNKIKKFAFAFEGKELLIKEG
ncbi:MAG: AAA family ATPase [Oribacterium sp.]|nr:AAA family ATPase [Oribacterium sp.]